MKELWKISSETVVDIVKFIYQNGLILLCTSYLMFTGTLLFSVGVMFLVSSFMVYACSFFTDKTNPFLSEKPQKREKTNNMRRLRNEQISIDGA